MQTPQRMQLVQSPVIPIIGDLVRNTPGTISFGQGVAYYGPPQEAQDALQEFWANPNNHKYHAVEGIPALQEAIRTKLQMENGISFSKPSNERRICVTAGGNMAFVNSVLAITDPGDEIILLTPFYFNHEMAVRMADCIPVCIPTDRNFQPDVNRIANAIGPKTKAVLTVSPNNPSGAVYPAATLQEINRLCMKKGIYHIHDEAYEYFVFDEAVHVSPISFADSEEHTICLFSLSKSYGFASWRIGYMVYPAPLEVSVKKIQDTILICPPIVSQYAALGALQAGVAYCRSKQERYRELRTTIEQGLRSLGDLCTLSDSHGAFYYLIDIDGANDSMELAKRLVIEHKVALMPGISFGLEQGCQLRLSYGALQPETAKEGIERLVQAIRSNAKP